jgi:GNAT superfamily N-acetyltransferase
MSSPANAQITWHTAERAQLRSLFALAEDSPQRLDAAIDRGRVLVATEDGEIVGFLQLVDGDAPDEVELLTMAVIEDRQGEGIGRSLITRAIDECRAQGARTLLVSTAAASVGNLRFYQRLGFRMLRVERDAFTAADGYPEGLTIEGIPLRDRVWLSLALS